MNKVFNILLVSLWGGLVLGGSGLLGAADTPGHDDHAGHDHGPAQPPKPPPAAAAHDDHAGHDHGDAHPPKPPSAAGAHDDHAGHDHGAHAAEEGVVHLNPAALKAADLALEPAGPGAIRQGWDVPGEIHFNADAIAKIGARVSGQVMEIHAATGAKVARGDLLAVLQSTDLGNAKIDYFTARVNLELAQKENARAQNLLASTRALLKHFDEPATPEELAQKVKDIRIGETKSHLLDARSSWRLARVAAIRATELKKDNLIAAADFEQRMQAAESAYALYTGAREEAELRGEIAALQTERALHLANLSAQNAERRLHIFGFSDAQVAKMTEEQDEVVARYEIRAPVAGTLIDRNLAVGEKISEEHTAFLLADLSKVWCNLQVSSHQLGEVRAGQRLTVSAPGIAAPIEATISAILPSIDEQSRSGTARAVLDNAAGLLKPGLFVTVRIETARIEIPLTVRISAVQTIANQPVVFVASTDGDEFTAKPVTLGRRDGFWVEILSGLAAGESVVIRNTFILKAELGKAGAKHEH